MPENSRDPLYFIALMPSAEIRNEIESIKKEIKEKYGIKHALKLPAHITLQIPFRMSDAKAEILIKELEKFSIEHNAFETRLDGFGKFSKQVIFIKIEDHNPYFDLYKELQDLILGFIELKKHELASKIHPHITIATRDLKRTEFPAVWNDFKDKNYSATFLAKDIFLLKHNGQTWDIFKKFSL